MEQVLALIRRIAALLLPGLALLVAACGNAPVDDSENAFLREAGGALTSSIAAGRSDPPPALTRDVLSTISVPVIQVVVMSSGNSAPALPFAENRNAQTWLTANDIAFVIKEGVLFATRGLGPDLLTAETDATLRAIRSRSTARYPRDMRFIDGDESIRKERYFCEIANDGPAERVVVEVRHRTTQLRETCFALEGSREFRNIYWIGADGTVWDSIQWVSPQFGYLTIQRLIR